MGHPDRVGQPNADGFLKLGVGLGFGVSVVVNAECGVAHAKEYGTPGPRFPADGRAAAGSSSERRGLAAAQHNGVADRFAESAGVSDSAARG